LLIRSNRWGTTSAPITPGHIGIATTSELEVRTGLVGHIGTATTTSACERRTGLAGSG
jgi:hypothetical protein